MHDLWKYSPLLWCLERTFCALERLSPANLLFGTRVQAQRAFKDEAAMTEAMLARGRRVEAYVACWFAIELVLAVLAPSSTGWLHGLCIALPLFRVFEVTQTAINLNLFERLRIHPSDSHFVASHLRTIVLTLWNYLELILCFGVVYSARMDFLPKAGHPLDAYYFSATTQLTIGFGDISPVGWGRLLAALQGVLGFFFFALVVLARMATYLPRSESLHRHSPANDPKVKPRPDDPE